MPMQLERQVNENAMQARTLIVGLGKTGLSCARFLAARGLPVAVVDSRDQPPGLEALRKELPGVALFTGGFDKAAFDAADRLIVSPGVSVRQPMIQAAVARGVELVGDIELFARYAAHPVVAITGSNGKSTVTAMLAAMASACGKRAAVGGNFGTPALDLLDRDVELYILELSSFQLETTSSLVPVAALVLNISADHLDRYDGIDDYASAKRRIYAHAERRIFNLDDAAVMAMDSGDRAAAYFTLGAPRADDQFGLREHAGGEWLAKGGERLMAVGELPLPGRHNQANALAALALGKAAGLPMAGMLDGLRRFRGLPHRTQYVAEIDGVRWYNDSKGTNPGATIAALNGFAEHEGRIVLIAGGQCKNADFTDLAVVARRACKAVVLFGQDAGRIAPVLDASRPPMRAADLREAVALAAEQARPGDIVLLSPACASFDMFSGFEDRGEQFVRIVLEYQE